MTRNYREIRVPAHIGPKTSRNAMTVIIFEKPRWEDLDDDFQSEQIEVSFEEASVFGGQCALGISPFSRAHSADTKRTNTVLSPRLFLVSADGHAIARGGYPPRLAALVQNRRKVRFIRHRAAS